MMIPRIIPVLLIDDFKFVKTKNFTDEKYIGDPINTVQIFNKKEVDEIVILDINATIKKHPVNIDYLKRIASEAFMPLAYGGGISNLNDIKMILNAGIEKVVINSYAVQNMTFINQASKIHGNQSIIISVDVKKEIDSYKVYTHRGKKKQNIDLLSYVQNLEKAGAGELIINSIDRDGTFMGYDIDLIKKISQAVSIPIIALGGAGSIEDFDNVIKLGKASAAAAGSFFVFCGSRDSILITYPEREDLEEKFQLKYLNS